MKKALLLLFALTASTPVIAGPPAIPPSASVKPTSTCGDSSHALGWGGSAYNCQAITGSAAAGGSTTQLQRNNAGALGGISGATTDGTSVTISSGNLKLSGATSGTAVLNAPATGGGTNTLPPGADTLAGIAATQTLSNKTLASPVISGTASGAATIPNSMLVTDPTNASNLSSGTVPAARGGAGTNNGILKANGSGVTSAAAAGTDYQAPISLTTTGTSGAATFVGNTLNVPQYTGGSGCTLANPTATAGPTAVNGSATTCMRSDAAPPVQKGSDSQFGIVQSDGTTITCPSGVCSLIGNVLAGTTQTITSAQWASCAVFQVKTSSQTLTLPLASGLAAGGCIVIQTQGQSATLAPNGSDAINGGTTGASTTIASGLTALVTKDAATANNLIVTPTTTGSGSPGGTNGAIQYNSSGSFGGAVITGLVKGNGTSAPAAAVAGTDYQAPITLTTTGTSGAATLISNTLNIPQYTGGGGGVTPNWITGMRLIPNTSSSVSISAGNASDSTNAASMTTSSTFYGSVSGAWTAGAGSSGSPVNKMGNGLTVASGTWYFVCLANNSGSPDFYFDTSSSCANRPSGISDTKVRVVNMFRTCTAVLCNAGASTSIAGFVQVPSPGGMRTFWNFDSATIGRDVIAGSVADQTRSLQTLSVPTGFKVKALFSATDGGTSHAMRFMSPDEPDLNVDSDAGSGAFYQPPDAVFGGAGYYRLDYERMTNTSAQVALRATGAISSSLTIWTRGYEWDQGRNGP